MIIINEMRRIESQATEYNNDGTRVNSNAAQSRGQGAPAGGNQARAGRRLVGPVTKQQHEAIQKAHRARAAQRAGNRGGNNPSFFSKHKVGLGIGAGALALGGAVYAYNRYKKKKEEEKKRLAAEAERQRLANRSPLERARDKFNSLRHR